MAESKARQNKEIDDLRQSLAEQRKLLERLQLEEKDKQKGEVATCCSVM